jgi:hypothetical protein
MILLSNGGSNCRRGAAPSNRIVVGTVDGIAVLDRTAQGWTVAHRALTGCFVSAVTALDDGTLFAATHGVGAARSRDGGITWTWINEGIDHFDLWSARAGKLKGKDVVCVGALPAHLYISEDAGERWRELPALRRTPSVSKWCFPPPPRIGHVKDIVIDGDRLLVGIEIGALLVVDGSRRELLRAQGRARSARMRHPPRAGPPRPPATPAGGERPHRRHDERGQRSHLAQEPDAGRGELSGRHRRASR